MCCQVVLLMLLMLLMLVPCLSLVVSAVVDPMKVETTVVARVVWWVAESRLRCGGGWQ
jgi:hypothetical protein